MLATVTDAQGTANLLGINQTIGVFPDRDCVDAAITVEDDLAGSGLEESFGDGNVTAGRVVARVTD